MPSGEIRPKAAILHGLQGKKIPLDVAFVNPQDRDRLAVPFTSKLGNCVEWHHCHGDRVRNNSALS